MTNEKKKIKNENLQCENNERVDVAVMKCGGIKN